MYILHLFPNEKFTADYVKRINQLFGADNHVFYIYYNSTQVCNRDDIKADNVIWGELFDDITRLKILFEGAERVILHSLLYENYKQLKTVASLVISTKKPAIWAIWGADLYNKYQEYHRSLNPKKIIKEYQRKRLIKKFYGVITSNDYQELKKRYKTQAKHFTAMYTYQFIEMISRNPIDDLIHIMVGHSATDNCRHIEVFEKLSAYNDKIRVYCPLSYPNNPEYIKIVSDRGKELFGDHFVPMTQFMKYPEYVQFLNQIDIGIFNNNRQQGNGNITNLLYLGKKIYMSKENTLLKTYRDLGAVIYDYEEIDAPNLLDSLAKEVSVKNHNIIVERYSDENFYKCWKCVFTE